MAPTQMLWVKETKLPEFLNIVIKSAPTHKHAPEPVSAEKRERLRAYLKSLPRGNVSPLDVREQAALERLHLGADMGAFGVNLPTVLGTGPSTALGTGSLPPAIMWGGQQSVSSIKYQVSSGMEAALPQVGREVESGKLKVESIGDRRGRELESKRGREVRSVAPKLAEHAKAYALPGLENKLSKGGTVPLELTTFLEPGEELETEVRTSRKLASEINFSRDVVIPITTPGNKIRLVAGVGKTRVRKLHFAPPANFDLSKLPIRGEKRFEISEELKRRLHLIDEDFEESQRKEESEVVTAESESRSKERKESKESRVVMATAVVQPRRPKGPAILRSVGSNIRGQDVNLKRLTVETGDSKISALGKKMQNVFDIPLNRAQILPLTSRPNVFSGQITTRGGEPIEGAIFIVREANGIPVRALKTNKLGQFLSATSLPNGKYTVEVEHDAYQFNPISVNLVGKILAPLGIKAAKEISESKTTDN